MRVMELAGKPFGVYFRPDKNAERIDKQDSPIGGGEQMK